MSRVVDERVVSMQFDNKNFESNVATSMSTIDKLKQKLNLSDSAKSFDAVNNAIKSVNVSSLSTAADNVRLKFTAMQVAAMTAISEMTKSVMTFGKRTISALTIDPVKTGLNEYETKINAIQTILSNTSSKGTTIDDVTSTLNELNEYADKTIYNFAEMTRNIGTFTAAGVGLEEAAAAIQGIANLAAASGSTSQQASTAMYQLSQALAAGTVKLMDWNSVVNAGMGGEKFQNALKETAREMGISVDSIIKKAGSFRDSLSEGWITADVLNTTLQKFTKEGAKEYADSMVKAGKYTQAQADALMKEAEMMEDAATKVKTFTQLWDTLKESAQSGWAQTWELIIGDFYEARDFLTKISDVIGGVINATSEWRNNLLGGALTSPWERLSKKIEEAGGSTEEFQNRVKQLAKDHNVDLDKMIEKEGSFEKALRSAFSTGHLDKSILVEALKGFVGATDEATESTKDLGKVVDEVIAGKWGTYEDRWNRLTEAGYDWAEVQNQVNIKLGSSVRHLSTLSEEQKKSADTLTKLTDEQLKAKGYTDEQIIALRDLAKAAETSGSSIRDLIDDFDKVDGRTLLIETLGNAFDGLSGIIKSVKDAWKGIFDPITSDQLYDIIEAVHRWSENLIVHQNTINKLTRVFKGLFAAVDIVLTVVGGPLRWAFEAVKTVLGMFNINILDHVANLGDAIVKLRDWIDENNLFRKGLEKVAPYVKEAVENFKSWFASIKESEGYKKFVDFLHTSAKAIRDWFSALGENEKIKSFLDFFKDAFGNIKEWFSGMKDAENLPKYIISGLVNGIKGGAKAVLDAIIGLGSELIEGFKQVLGIASPSKVMIALGGFIIAGLITGLTQDASGVLDVIKNLGTSIWTGLKNILEGGMSFLSNLDFGSVLAIGITGGAAVGAFKILDIFEKLTTPLEGIGKLAKSAAGLLTGLKDGFNDLVKSSKLLLFSNAIMNFAKAIAILVGAVIAMTLVDSGKLWEAVGVLSAIVTIVVLLASTISKLNNFEGDLKVDALPIASILAIAGTVLLMSIAMKKLAGIDEDAIGGTLALFLGLVVGLIGLVDAFSRFKSASKGELIEVGKTLLLISAAMYLMSIVMKTMSKMETSAMKKGASAILAFTGIIALLIWSTKLAGKDIDKVASTIGKIGLTMLLMAFTIGIVGKMKVSTIAKGLIVMTAFGGLITGLIAATKLAGGRHKIDKLGATILMISGAMAIMALTIQIVGGMSVEKINKGLVVMAAFGGLITGLIAATRLVGDKNLRGLGPTIMSLAVAIGIMGLVVTLLGALDLAHIAKGIFAVGMLSGMMAVMIRATRGASDCKANLIVMTVAIGIMAVAVAALSFIDGKKLAGATVAIGSLMGIFALMTFVTKYSKNTKQQIRTLITMTAIVVVIGGVIAAVSHFIKDPASALASATAIGIVLGALVASISVLGNVKGGISKSVQTTIAWMGIVLVAIAGILVGMSFLPNASALIPAAIAIGILLNALTASIAVLGMIKGGISKTVQQNILWMGLALAGIAAILVGLNFLPNPDALIPTAVALSTVLLAMSAACAICSVIPISGAVTGALGLSAFIGIMAALLVILGGLSRIPGVNDLVKDGGEFLANIGYAIGKFVGSIIGGIGAGISSALPEIADNLSLFAMKIVPFMSIVKMVDASVLKGVGILAGAIIALSAASFINGILSFLSFGSDFASLGQQLSDFIVGATPFILAMSTIKPETLEGVKTLSEAILTLTASSLLDGLTKFLTGGSSLEGFGTQLGYLADGLLQFSNGLSGFDESKLETVGYAAEAVKTLAEASKAIPNSGGLIGALVGENDLSSFASQFPMLGMGIKGFLTSVGDFSEEDASMITSASEAVKALAEASKEIPDSGGLLAALVGDNNLGTFATQFPNVGKGIRGLLDELGVLSPDEQTTVESAAKVVKILAEAAKQVPNSGGRLADLIGDNELGTFAEQFPKVGEGIRGFVDKLGTFTEDELLSVNAGVKAIKAITALASLDLSTISNTIFSFGTSLDELGTKFGSFCQKFVDIDITSLTLAINRVDILIDLLKRIEGVDADAAKSFKDALNDLGKASVKKFVEGFTNDSSKSSVQDAAKKMLGYFIDGAEDKQSDVEDAFEDIAKDSAGAIKKKSVYKKFKDAGKYLGDGLIEGIEAKEQEVYDAAYALGQKAVQGEKDGQASNSPSKLTIQAGKWLGEGLIVGMDLMRKSVYTSGHKLGEAATGTISSTISRIADAVNSDIDTQPTIRPVLDLSDVEAGANSLNGMFGSSVGVLSRVGTVNTLMNRYSQNGANGDVVSAINKLRKDLNNVGTTQYNINGVTYDDGSNISSAVEAIVRAAKVERRI